ncbi:MAG TPA: hypothetical protein VIK95_11505 [Egibacteraceae bacterium]
MTRRTVLISVLVVVVIGLLGAGAYALVRGDDDGPPWQRGWHGGGWDGPGWGRGGWHGRGPDPDRVVELRAELAADLGEQLDVPAEDVEAAFRAVAEQRLREAAADGRIDGDDVDDALAAYDEGDVGALMRVVWRAREEAPDRSTESR